MFINSNDKCPVCKNNFAQEDDVVFCPICGTPHHRECYNSIGHCFNSPKHGTDFEYKSETAQVSENDALPNDETKNENNNDYYIPENSDFNTESEQSENNPNTISGFTISDIRAIVRTNTERFVPLFLKNKKFSWNWGGLFFGPYYLFFRKMYKQGSAFLAVSLIVQYFLNGIFVKEISAFTSFINANYDAIKQLYTTPDAELIIKIQEAYQPVLPMMYILLGTGLIIHIIIALLADRFYKTRILNILGMINDKLGSGRMFSSITPMLDDNKLSQADMKKLYLGKLGGTSLLSPVVAWCTLDIITGLVSRIISLF